MDGMDERLLFAGGDGVSGVISEWSRARPRGGERVVAINHTDCPWPSRRIKRQSPRRPQSVHIVKSVN